jgi:replication termination factor 2
VKEAQREQLEHHWTSCPLSHKPLARPIVSDSAGNLYNKDAILKFLIPSEEVEGISSKADCEEILQGRVKGLRDVVELKLEVDTEHTATETAKNNSNNNNNNNNGNGKMSERWICPITTKQLGPSVKSVYLVPCGHVFSEEAIREMKGDKCLQVRADSPPIRIVFVVLIIWNSVTKNIRMTTLSRSSPPKKPTTSVY